MTNRSRAELFLLSTTLIWGSTFVAAKIGMTGMSAMQLIALRFTMASILFLFIFRGKVLPASRESLLQGALLGLLLFLGFVAQTVGLNYTTASKSSFITSMMVVVVPLLQFLIEHRPPTMGNVVGVVIVCSGLWLMTSPSGSEFSLGDALTLACAVLFGLYVVYLDIVSKRMTVGQLSFIQVSICAVLGWAGVMVIEDMKFPASSISLIALVYLTIFATVLTTYIQTKFQKDTTPTRAAIIFTIEPVFASLFAFAILNERIGVAGVVGGALIIAGILFSELSDSIPAFKESITGRDS